MNVIEFPLCLRNCFGKLFQPVWLQALRQFPSVFHLEVVCISQLCLGRGVCILFQKATAAFGVGVMVWSPRICICAGICSGAMQGQLLQMLGMVRDLMTLVWFSQCSA